MKYRRLTTVRLLEQIESIKYAQGRMGPTADTGPMLCVRYALNRTLDALRSELLARVSRRRSRR